MANVRLEWDEIEDNGGSPVQNHWYRRRIAGSGETGWSDWISAGPDLFEVIIGLSQDDWEFQVVGENDIGFGEPSNIARALLGDTTPPPTVTDVTRPKLVVHSIRPKEVRGPFVVTITSDENVIGFTKENVKVVKNEPGGRNTVAGTVSDFKTDGRVATAKVTPTLTEDGSIEVYVPGNVVQDAAGNQNEETLGAVAFYIVPTVDNPAPTDTTRPTVRIERAGSVSVSGSFTISIIFSKVVGLFEAQDIQISGGYISNLTTNSGLVWTAIVNPQLTADGIITITIPAGVAQDASGNMNTASTQFVVAYQHPVVEVPTTTGQPQQPQEDEGDDIVASGGLWVPRIIVSDSRSTDDLPEHQWNVRNGRYIRIGNQVFAWIEGIVGGNARESLGSNDSFTSAAFFTPPIPIGHFDVSSTPRFTNYEEGTGERLYVMQSSAGVSNGASIRIDTSIGDSDATGSVAPTTQAEFNANLANAQDTSNYSFLVSITGTLNDRGGTAIPFKFAILYKTGVTAYGTAPVVVGGALLDS